jgi:hypothetical protein
MVHEALRVVEAAARDFVDSPGLVHARVIERGQLGHPASDVIAARTNPCDCRTGLKTRFGRVSFPVPATHYQLPALLAILPSTRRSTKCAAPRRQSM